MASVLARIENGPAVLHALQQVRDEVTRAGSMSSAVLNIIIRQFALTLASAGDVIVARVRTSAKPREESLKAIAYEDGRNRWNSSITSKMSRDAGRRNPNLYECKSCSGITAHVAKGLEFNTIIWGSQSVATLNPWLISS